jgi:benzodiazapine receptor
MLFIKKDTMKLIASIVIPFIAAAIGGLFTSMTVNTWYKELVKPWFAPPDFVFGPVWTILYLLMGISFFLVWRETDNPTNQNAVKVFYFQLLFNILWSAVFFGMKSILGGLIVIIILWIGIIAMIKAFYSVSKLAGILQIPYLLWVTFATILNFALYMLNM